MDRILDRDRVKVKRFTQKSHLLTAILPLVFLGIFYFYPLSKIFEMSFIPEGSWEITKLKKLVTTGYYLKTLWFTFWQAGLSTILTLVAALPGAYVFARYSFPGKKLIQSLITVPFVLPAVVVAAAFQALSGPNGLLNVWLMDLFCLESAPIEIDQTVGFILLAHVFYNYAIVLRIVGGFWARMGPDFKEAAQMLGASPWQTFLKITLPMARPALLAAGLLVFVFCFSSFGVVLILGGPRLATIEVEIYIQAVNMLNLPMAAALSIVQIVFTFGVMWYYTRLQRKTSIAFYPETITKTQRRVSSCKEKLVVFTAVASMLIFLGSPLLALMIRSFSTESGFSLAYYTALFVNVSQSIFFVPPVRALAHSLGIAGITLIMSLSLGLMAAAFLAGSKSRLAHLMDPLFMLPLSTSAVTLGFGFIIALDEPPLNLRTSYMLVPLAHTLVAFPFVVRSILPALRSIPKSLKESAALLGASPLAVWKLIDLPITGRALLAGAVFAFTVSMGEFGATMFVARPQTPTLPLAVYRFLGQPGAMNYGQAMAMSSILMLVTAVGFIFIEKARVGSVGRF